MLEVLWANMYAAANGFALGVGMLVLSVGLGLFFVGSITFQGHEDHKFSPLLEKEWGTKWGAKWQVILGFFITILGLLSFVSGMYMTSGGTLVANAFVSQVALISGVFYEILVVIAILLFVVWVLYKKVFPTIVSVLAFYWRVLVYRKETE